MQCRRWSTIVIFLTLLVFLQGSAQAKSEAWWPSEKSFVGGYCGESPDRLRSVVRRGPRDGLVQVPVIAEGLSVRVGSNRHSYRRGQVAYFRVENIGTVRIWDLREYHIEKETEDGWVVVGPKSLKWPLGPPPLLSSGRARCWPIDVPTHAHPGMYRFSKIVEQELSSVEPIVSVDLEREFRVVP